MRGSVAVPALVIAVLVARYNRLCSGLNSEKIHSLSFVGGQYSGQHQRCSESAGVSESETFSHGS